MKRSSTNDIQDNLIIRNGCGGTRAAYGTTVLLRTTAALLDTIHKVLDGSITENTLINIDEPINDAIDRPEYNFVNYNSEPCKFCGRIRVWVCDNGHMVCEKCCMDQDTEEFVREMDI